MSIFMVDDTRSAFLILSRPVILRELQRYKSERKLSDVAKRTGLDNARLTDFLNGRREISTYYLLKFLQGGVVSVKQILGNRSISELPLDDQRLIYRNTMIDDELVDLLQKADQKKIQLKPMLKGMLGEAE